MKFIIGWGFSRELLVMAFVVSSGSLVFSQDLPEPTGPVGCEEVLSYLDHAIGKAQKSDSNAIFILRMGESTSIKAARKSILDVKKYMRFRGFSNFEVSADFYETKAESIDMFISGRILYSVPIGRFKSLDLSICVAGPPLE